MISESDAKNDNSKQSHGIDEMNNNLKLIEIISGDEAINEITLNNDKKQSQEMGAIIEIIQNTKRWSQEMGAIIEIIQNTKR